MGQQSSIMVRKPRPAPSRIVSYKSSPSQMEVNNTLIGTAETSGSGLFSTIHLNPGEAVIAIQKPLLLIAENQALHRVCANCFTEMGEGVELKPCSDCGVVKFCCDGCEKLSKSEGFHKTECLSLKSRKPFEHSRAQISAQAITNTACAFSNCRSQKAALNCTSCKAVNYCDKHCQLLDHAFHEEQCKNIQAQSLGSSLNKILPTAVRSTIQLASNPTTLTRDSPFMELMSNEDELRKSQLKWDDILLQAHATTNLLQWKPEFVKFAIDALCRVNISPLASNVMTWLTSIYSYRPMRFGSSLISAMAQLDFVLIPYWHARTTVVIQMQL